MIGDLRTALKRLAACAIIGGVVVFLGAQALRSPAEADLAPLRAETSDTLRAQPVAPADAAPFSNSLRPPPRPTRIASACDVTFDATPQVGGTARLTLSAPCNGGASVGLRHETVAFDVTLSHDGVWTGVVPGLSGVARFEATSGGRTYSASATLPDIDDYTRVVLHGEGIADLHIHALEYGAARQGEGHVWAGAPGTDTRAMRAVGGFLLQLGDGQGGTARTAEVYTFPAGLSQRSGAVRLSIEAAITADSCARDIAAHVVQPGIGGGFTTTAITIAMPACGAPGDILVLKNILRDMKIAIN